MQSFTYLMAALCATATCVSASPRKHHHEAGPGAGAVVGSDAGAAAGPGAVITASSIGSTPVPTAAAAVSTAPSNATSASGAVTRGSQTIVLFEVGGVPGNECLTFRNNGEIVDAACVDTSADRQVTLSTIGSQFVLLVQRSFDAGFRADLVGVDACVGFNGTDFKAKPCDAADVTLVSLVGGKLQAGTACASGHDGAAQLTVDTTGATCAQYTTTDVTATAP